MSTPWFAGIPTASATVECGGDTHTVEWRNGAFHIPAHADPDGERALAALAGEANRCVELLSAWERHAEDSQVLLLGPRGHGRLGENPDLVRAQLRGRRQTGFPPVPEATPLQSLLQLDGPIPRRLVGTVAAALLPRRADPEIAAELYGAVYGRLLAVLRGWRATLPQLDLAITDGEPSLIQTRDGHFHAALSPRWLTDVWARDLDVVDDELTVSARPATGGGFELQTVDHRMRMHPRTTGAG